MKSNKIIISADDFGLNEKSNRNILDLAKNGKLDRVAVMPFGKFQEDDVTGILGTGVKLDIHLHVERMKSDSFENNGQHQGILRRIGNFISLICRSGNIEDAHDEWEKQFDEFEKVFGRKPDGINSHEHIHFFPPYFRLALVLQKKMSSDYFRFGRNGVVGGTPTAIILKLLGCLDRKILRNQKTDIPTSDYFVSFDWLSDPEKFIGNIPENITMEILFHPMRDNEYEFLKNL